MSERRQWVDYPLSKERTQAAWRRVHARLGRRPPPAFGRVLAVAAVIAALVVGWSLRPHAPAHAGQSISTQATSLELSLDDGSRLELGPGSSLQVESESERLVALKLLQGSVVFDVVKRPGREFRVDVEDVSVMVVGTRFKVERRENAAVSVSVERGAVDVLRRGDRKRLGAGEAWSMQQSVVDAVVEPPFDAGTVDAGVEVDAGVRLARAPVEKPKPVKVAPPTEPSADEVFSEMVSKRRAARWAEAAEVATKFLDRFPKEPRAGLVAFELGRMQMDRLGAHAAAAVRLRQAVVLAPTAPFVEDALAREVRALSAAGDKPACLSRQAAFIERFPSGLHRTSVESACR